jgi:hypothetical protein
MAWSDQSILCVYLQAYKAEEERAESWEKLAWLREQAQTKRRRRQLAQSPQEEEEEEEEEEPASEPAATEQEPAAEEGDIEAAAAVAPEAQAVEAAADGVTLRVRMLYDEEDGLNGVERVLQGMVASRGGQSIALKVRVAVGARCLGTIATAHIVVWMCV